MNNIIKPYTHLGYWIIISNGHKFWLQYALWSWHWRYDLGSRSCHYHIGSWTAIGWNIQIKHGSNWVVTRTRHGFSDYLAVGCLTLGQGHDTTLSNGKELKKVMDNNWMVVHDHRVITSVKYYIQTNLEVIRVMAQTWILADVHCDLDFGDNTLGHVHACTIRSWPTKIAYWISINVN